MLKIPYGYKDGELIHISKAEKGLQCGASCPLCGNPLQANKGTSGKVSNYFKHKNNTSECIGSIESILHIVAKEIIKKEQKIKIPALLEGTKIIQLPKIIDLHEVILENKIDDIIPDIVCKSDEGEILIEIKVTHGIDEIKRNKIIKLGINTIEIELKKDSIYSSDEYLKDSIINNPNDKKWIYNRKTIDYEINKEKEIQEKRNKATHIPWVQSSPGIPVSSKRLYCRRKEVSDSINLKTCKSCFFYYDDDKSGVYCNFKD